MVFFSETSLAWDTIVPKNGAYPEYNATAICRYDSNNYYWGNNTHYWQGKFFGRNIWGRGSGGSNTGFGIGGRGIHTENGKQYYIGPLKGSAWDDDGSGGSMHYYAYAICEIVAKSSCTFNGSTVAHDSSVTAYQSSSVPFGSTCTSQTRTCNDGTLSGSYAYSSCSVSPPANCTFNGSTVTHGSSTTAYLSSSVSYGSSCTSQSRSCNNGSLSGSYSRSSCSAISTSNRTLTTNEDTNGTLTLNVNSPVSGLSYTYTIVSQPANGSASISGSTLTFTPNKDWNGSTSLTYRATDSNGSVSNTSTVSITVNPVNDPPVAQAKSMSMLEDSSGSVTLTATDIDSPTPTTFQIVTAPNSSHGTATLTGSQLTFTPKPDWNGSTSLTYRAQDSSGAWSSPATVSITVMPVNDTPSVTNLSGTVAEDNPLVFTLPVTDVDLNFEGDSHTWSVVTAPNAAHGTVTISGNKATFTPKPNWNGSTSFTYRATDSKGANSNTATVSVTVTPVNDKPIVHEKRLSIPEDTNTTILLTLDDVDLGFEGDSHSVEVIGELDVDEGSFSLSGRNLTITPAKDFNGTLSLSYRVKDSHGVYSDPEPIVVEVTYVPDAPAATGGRISAKEGMASDHLDPWVVDVDIPYGDKHSFTIEEEPSNGTVKVIHNRVEYTPNPAYYGPDQFKIRATDQDGLSVVGDVDVVVEKFNYAPTGISPKLVEFFAGVGGEASFIVSDPNTWGSHSLKVIEQPEHGSVTVSGLGIRFKTDGEEETSFVLRAIDQDGLYYDETITLKPKDPWAIFEGRPVTDLAYIPRIPAINVQMTNRSREYAFQVKDAPALAALGKEIVAIVTPDSSVGLTLQHRALSPGKAMNLTPEKLTGSYLEARLGAIQKSVEGTADVYLTRADRTGPVYRVPVQVWSPKGELRSEKWSVVQAIERTSIRFEQSNAACAVNTNESVAKLTNPLDEPTCYVTWTKTPAEWRDIGNLTSLTMEATGLTVGDEQVEATAYVYDQFGNKHEISTFSADLKTLAALNASRFALKPVVSEAYQKVDQLSLSLRLESGMLCDPVTSDLEAKKTAAQWLNRPACLIRWLQLPEGLEQRPSSSAPELKGAIQTEGSSLISWKASIFTPSGTEVEIGHDSHEITSLPPPPLEVELPTTNLIKDRLYWVSQDGGMVGSSVTHGIPADIEQVSIRDGEEISRMRYSNYGRPTRATHYIIGAEAPLWSVTPYSIEAAYVAMPEMKTVSEIELLATPSENIRPVILNGEDQILDTQSLTVNAAIRDVRYLDDGYQSTSMGDWDVRLLMTTAGIDFQPITDWEPINTEGIAQFEIALETLTNKVVRIVAEARVRSPVPEYTLVRKSPYPLVLSVLNGDPLDGSIQAMRIIGPAPLRSSFYAITNDRYESRDLGAVRWEMSSDGGATWQEVSSNAKLPQRLTWIFERGSYLLRAELTNRHSGAKSMTPTIEVIAYVVPAARLKGPQNVFIGDYGTFRLTDVQGAPLNTEGMIIEWSEDRGKTWTVGEESYKVTRDIAERVYLMARLKYSDSPDDKRVYKTLRAGVAFRPVRPPRVQIIGPRRPEVGKEATWKANLMMPYPNMDLTMDGEFIMPTGEVVKELEVKYTPTQEDMDKEESYIAVRSWINGYEEKGGLGITQHRLIFWEYDWPTWRIVNKLTAEYAPAELSMVARAMGLFREFEGLKMEWEIPPYPGMTVVKDTSQTSRIVGITEPGTYEFGVHISDGRGNYSYVDTQLEFKEPIPWNVELSWSGDNPANRAPLGVLIRPTITGGHPKDRISTRQYSLDGEPLDAAGEYGRATLPAPGVYTAQLDITSEMGHSARGTVNIPVNTNKSPSCTLEVTTGRTSWLAKAGCADEDGRIVKHLWFINGVAQAISSSSISVPMWRHPDGEPVITVVGVDDSGAESPPVANK